MSLVSLVRIYGANMNCYLEKQRLLQRRVRSQRPKIIASLYLWKIFRMMCVASVRGH
jgi:hypothetical protein